MKYKITELFVGKFPNPSNIYSQLQDLQRQIDDGAEPKPVIKEDVKLTKTGLKKVFGDAKDFDTMGIIRNVEGSYIVISDGKNYKYIALEDL